MNLSACPNCGAPLAAGQCAQCGAVVPLKGAAVPAPRGAERTLTGQVFEASCGNARLEVRGGRFRSFDVARIFAMPMASTRPQSAGHGVSFWVCAAAKPTLARRVLARGLKTIDEAAWLAFVLAEHLHLLE